MNIVILGAGAMGGVFGYQLHEAGHQVTLIDNRPEPVQAINERGLIADGLGGGRHFPLKAVERPSLVDNPVDLLLVLVKAYDTGQAGFIMPEPAIRPSESLTDGSARESGVWGKLWNRPALTRWPYRKIFWNLSGKSC